MTFLFCWFGWHRWNSYGASFRYCQDCGHVQRLQRTMEWETA